MAKRETFLRYTCPECGGDNCGYDANSVWDEIAQDWTLGSSFDDGWCSDCGDVEPEEHRMSRAEVAEVKAARARLPENRLRAALADAERALALAIERVEINDCEGEERPFLRELRTAKRQARQARRAA